MAVKNNPSKSDFSYTSVRTDRSTDKRVKIKNSYLTDGKYPYFANKCPSKAATVAGVPVKFGNCTPVKYSIQVPDSTITLNNRFQCLQNSCDSQNNVIHDDIHTCTDVFPKKVHSVPSNEFKVKNYAKQHSVECKPSPTYSNDMSQPLLATQAKLSFSGNKNGNGFFAGDVRNMEEQGNDRLSTSCTKTHESKNFDSTANCQLGGVVCTASDVHRESQLTTQEIHTLVGNKNGTGLSDGVEVQVSSSNPSNIHSFNITAGDYDGVTTDNVDLVFDQNYNLNISDIIEGDTAVTKNQKNLVNVVSNNIHTFGFCPLTPLKLYTGDPVSWNVCHTDLEAHAIVTATGKPNYLAARIPVASQLNIENWRSYLSNYWDVQLLDLLEYGFPLDVDRDTVLTSTETNHTSALQNSFHVQSYIQEELSFQAMLGPFQAKPISLHISHLMVRDKQDSKRTIMDLSWPKGASVNASVSKDVYLDTQYALTYPSIDSIVSSLVKLSPAALIYKVDISRAFRQINIDPKDIDLLGLKFQNQYFIDKSVPFGYRNGSQIFQRCTDAISLLYISKCVKPARFFLNRILALLRNNHSVSKILLNQPFFQDLSWFNTFLTSFNGITYYDKKFPTDQVYLDACLTGLGGHYGPMIYALEIPLGYQNYDICHLEMLNIVVASKIWAAHWRDRKIRIFCDNMAVVQVMNTGRARDQTLATCARNIWLIAATFNIEFIFSHISGQSNNIADLLSRWGVTQNPLTKLNGLLQDYVWVNAHLDLTLLNYSI